MVLPKTAPHNNHQPTQTRPHRLGNAAPITHATAQELTHTASRHSGPRRWLKATRWLLSAGIHPRGNATTLRIAEDLATRMDYSTGHVLYCLDGISTRLALSRATVKRHVAVLRELGSLVWVMHGTKANIRRKRGLSGYAGTATVYAAVIPPVYDHAMGHQIVGTGYDARIVIHQQSPARPVDNSLVDDSCSRIGAPPSLTLVKEERKVQMTGGFNYTSRRCASRTKHHPSHSSAPASRTKPAPRSPAQAAREILETRTIRALVNWTQSEPLRRLAFSLRAYFDRGLNAHEIAAELIGLCLTWRPARPAAYIQAHLRREADDATARDSAHAAASDPQSNIAWQEWLEQTRLETPTRTDTDRRLARLYSWDQWSEVADHYAEDPDDALDLYGTRLCVHAIRQASLAEATPRHV
ncbi:cell wall protein [Streptomyces rectiviolaceus]|uniref:cell wall protein n=1 Tax=Streptomyces rectiviolaceus TaxID=332591 RepID=UPI003629D1A2